MEFAIFVHRKRLEMKKFYYLLLVVVALSSGLQSCDNGKTYAEMKEDEADAINSYINQNDIKVISEAEFAAMLEGGGPVPPAERGFPHLLITLLTM